MVVSVSQKVFCEVEFCVDEPFCSWELGQVVYYEMVFIGGFYLCEFPHCCPEVWYVFDRPLVQLVIVGDLKTVLFVDEFDESGYVGFFYAFSGGCP